MLKIANKTKLFIRRLKAYLPRGRASHHIGRIRFWPEVNEGPVLLGFAGYKAGMTYAIVVEDKKRSPNYGKEVIYPVSIIDTPPIFICAVKAYTRDTTGLKTLTEAWTDSLSKDFNRIKGVPKNIKTKDNFKKIEDYILDIIEFRIIAATQPRLTGVPKKKPDLMEIKIGGGTVKEQFEYIKNILGKTISIENVFREGQLIDVISITKGKGWQGPVKRWGVRILQNKANKTKRGIATLGPWGPARVLYTVPRAGQMGYHQRTEFNKKILKMGKNGKEVTPKGGFLRYGLIRNTYLILKGSIPGPAKRLIRFRYPARPKKIVSDTSPKISFISVETIQGA